MVLRMAAEATRSGVLAGLRMLDVAQLENCCEKLSLTVAEAKKGKRKAVENIVMRHLTSETLEESEDEGMSVYLMLHDHIKSLLDSSTNNTIKQLVEELSEIKSASETERKEDAVAPNIEVKKETPETKPADAAAVSVELHKFRREFKITGGTVPDQVDFINLSNQMYDGLEAGYTEKEIRSGVVKAMKPGTSLRRHSVQPCRVTMNRRTQRHCRR